MNTIRKSELQIQLVKEISLDTARFTDTYIMECKECREQFCMRMGWYAMHAWCVRAARPRPFRPPPARHHNPGHGTP